MGWIDELSNEACSLICFFMFFEGNFGGGEMLSCFRMNLLKLLCVIVLVILAEALVSASDDDGLLRAAFRPEAGCAAD